MSRKSTTMSSRFAKFARGQGETARRAYAFSRRVLHWKSHVTRRDVARAARPDETVAVPLSDGYRRFSPGTFPEADEGARASAQLLERSEAVLAKRGRKHSGKKFLVNLLEASAITPDHPLLRLALRADLLDAVISYMGTVPILRTIQVFYSGSVDREPISSQLYHCDADDVRQLKIFLLCNEVRRENGPLTLLDAASSDRVRRETGYTFSDRLSDDQVVAVLGEHQPFELVGRPGTMCFVDTSRCFHYGSRVDPGAGPRLVAMVQYLSPFAFVLPDRKGKTAPLGHLVAEGQSAVQRAILTGEDRDL